MQNVHFLSYEDMNENINTELESEQYKPKQFIFKQWKRHQNMVQSDSENEEEEEKGDTFPDPRRYSDYAINSEMEIALEIDDNGYVIERRNSLPINGPRRLSQGNGIIMNGEEQEQRQLILGKMSMPMPMSPVLPDLSFNNDTVFSMHADQDEHEQIL